MKLFSTKQPPATSNPEGEGHAIVAALQSVEQLRQRLQQTPDLGAAVQWVKGFQTHRFERHYQDFLQSPIYGGTATFFLTRLYGDAQPQQRDAQFARIAHTIAKIFPEQVVQTAVAVSQLHALTEQLDTRMGESLLAQGGAQTALPLGLTSPQVYRLYGDLWRAVGDREARMAQLQQVIALGQTMGQLVKIPGLALSLKLMRGPAQLAQLGELQNWLEQGFTTFAALHKHPGGVAQFLSTVQSREQSLIDAQFDSDPQMGIAALGPLPATPGAPIF